MALTFGIDLHQTEEFIAGILYGFVQHDDLTEIEQCLQNGERLESEIEAIVTDLSTLNLSNIVDAIKKATALVEEIPTDLAQCKDLQGDLDKITTWAKSISLKKIPGNVLKHLSAITKDIQTIENDWQVEDFEKAGEVTTDILFMVLGDPKEAVSEDVEFLF